MDKLTSQRLDALLANLKPVEPSADFEFELGRRLRESALSVREEPAILRSIKLALENIRYNLLPRTPALVRVAVGGAFIMSIGLYFYGAEPMMPSVVSDGRVIAYTVSAGTIVESKAGEDIDIILKNKYTVRLKENTRVKIARLTPRLWSGAVDMHHANGEALVSVDKAFSGSRFIIDTGAGRVTALGTKFAVSVADARSSRTAVAVLEGMVKVASGHRPKRTLFASNVVMVGSGQKTEMSVDSPPARPQRLMESEWAKLDELYQIGKKPQVSLLIKSSSGRVYELLRPCPLYVSDEKPRDIPEVFETAVRKIEEALKTGDISKHLEAIRLLETMVNRYPNPRYNPQFLLYIGSYYEYIGMHQKAIDSFERVVRLYPDSQYASLALAAQGVIYEAKIGDIYLADKTHKKILKDYPNSLEAILAEEKLGIKKVS